MSEVSSTNIRPMSISTIQALGRTLKDKHSLELKPGIKHFANSVAEFLVLMMDMEIYISLLRLSVIVISHIDSN